MRLPQDPRDGAWRLAAQASEGGVGRRAGPRGVPGHGVRGLAPGDEERSPGPAPAPASPGTRVSPGTPASQGIPASPGTPASPQPAAYAESPVYPLSLRLAGHRVVVVGGGSVALRRVAGLRTAGADILVVSPQLGPTLGDLAARGLITARTRGYEPGDLDGAWLVLACTDQPRVNAAVAADAERQRIWCVRADDAAASAAWIPATGRSGPVTVAVNAGRNPRRAAALRDRFVATVDAEGRLAEKAGEPPDGGPRPDGRVSIVGGGPGDPGLITVTGLRRLREADVVVADRLAPLELLDELPPDTYVIDAAKVPGGPAMRQDHINHALVEHARAGRAVVRLKGGDPFVFGRGREELEACLTAGVPVEVIPGVTSAISVPAAAGIPVTHRGLSQGFCVLAGHVRPGDPRSSVDWAALARSGMTLVLLMAIDHLAAIAGALMAAGLAADTPAAAISDGWTRRQRVVTAPLADLSAAVSRAGVANPAVIVIGDVAELAPGPGYPAAGGPSRGQPGNGPAPATGGTAGPTTHAPSTATTQPATTSAATQATTAPLTTQPATTSAATQATTAPLTTQPATTSAATQATAVPLTTQTVAASLTTPAAVTSCTAPAPRAAAAPATPLPRRILVLGGARSGKSQTAEGMLAGYSTVDYVATGTPPGAGDEEWDARVREHQRRRPAHWCTVETPVLTDVLAQTADDGEPGSTGLRPPTPVLVDCLTTWLARVMDECGAWAGDADADEAVAARIDGLLGAWQQTRRHVVAVSNEIGSGVVPQTASGRRFRDELGRLNARIAAASDEVWLCTAGIARRLQ